MVISILFVDKIVAASSASTISVSRKRDNRHVYLALEGSRFHKVKSADALANYPKVPSAHSLVAGQSSPGLCTSSRGHAVALKTVKGRRNAVAANRIAFDCIPSGRRSHPLEGRITFLTRNLAALEKRIPMLLRKSSTLAFNHSEGSSEIDTCRHCPLDQLDQKE